MRHLDSLTIGAFRGLRDVKLEGLGSVNVLVGDNNSGKTSVLEALALGSLWLTDRLSGPLASASRHHCCSACRVSFAAAVMTVKVSIGVPSGRVHRSHRPARPNSSSLAGWM